jgi:hypothetical protein
MNAKNARRKPRWITEMSSVLVALAQSRRTLRQAAMASGDRRMSHRLRRLARRRRAAAEELKRAAPASAVEVLAPDPDTIIVEDQIRTATEIEATAACLRANRKLRAAIESTLDANPPSRVHKQLEALRDQADHDAATYNARLRELVVVAIPLDSVALSHGEIEGAERGD